MSAARDTRGARQSAGAPRDAPGLGVVLREWGRIGCVGFGGPPAHIAMLRRLVVDRRAWLDDEEVEHLIATTNLLPGERDDVRSAVEAEGQELLTLLAPGAAEPRVTLRA